MSLYVRVFNNFYTHRKTARLRGILGNDALWIPPRLWAYAAENQPDGRFIEYTAKELAMLIGYSGNASRMLQALLDVGFMDADPLAIHDWHEHNGYHKSYAERASKAAAARWNKPPSDSPELKVPDKTVPDLKGKETSNASSILEASNRQRTVIEPSVQPSLVTVPASTRFKKPTLDEIKFACAKAGLPEAEAERFHNYYESNGWRVGKNPMRSWSHAIGNWKKNFDERRTMRRDPTHPSNTCL